jgi:hypothetical protein
MTIVQFAAAAGALTATKRGALPAIPYRSEVETFLLNHSLNRRKDGESNQYRDYWDPLHGASP